MTEITTVGGVKTEAQLERERIARQQQEAEEEARRQAEEATRQAEAQAEEVRGQSRQEAAEAQEKARAEALARQAAVRKAQGESERQAEALKGQARETRRIELRKQDLPFTKPERAIVNIQSYVKSVESAREQAHKEGRTARAEIERIKDDYVAEVDKELKEAIADISQQELTIKEDIAKQLMEAQADISKQVAVLMAGVDEWEAEGIAELNKAEAEYNKLLEDIAPYKLGEGYNLTAMIQAGYNANTLAAYGFAQSDIVDAQLRAEALETLKPYKLEGNTYNITEAIIAAEKGEVSWEVLNTVFGADVVEAERPNAKQVATFETYGDFIDEDNVIDVKGLVAKYGDDKAQVILADLGVENPYRSYKLATDPEYAFEYMKSTGDIRESAKYVGYDAETGEIQYTDEPTEADWRKLFFSQPQNIQTSYIFRQAPYLGKREWWDLSDKEKKQVLADFSSEFNYMGWLLSLTAEEQRTEAKGMVKRAAIGLIPGYGTYYNWNDMSPTWRAISVALDVVFFALLIKSGVSTIKGFRAPITFKAKQIMKAEANFTKQMVTKLRAAYGRATATAYGNMAKAQGKYVTALAKAEQIVAKGGTVSRESKLGQSLVKLEANLRVKAQKFVTAVKPKLRTDSREVARMFTTLPDDMVRNAKSVVGGLQSTANIKTLQAAVTKAEGALKAAQMKHPTDSSKWVDLLYDLAVAETKLGQAKTGSIVILYRNLLKAMDAAKMAKKSLVALNDRLAKTTNATAIAKLKGQIIKVKGIIKRAADLKIEFNRAINTMEIEYGAGGSLTRGGVSVATKPLSPTGTMKPLNLGTKPSVMALMAAIGGRAMIVPISTGQPVTTTTQPIISPEVVKEAKATPEVVAIAETVTEAGGLTGAEVINLSQIALDVTVQALAQNITGTELRNLVEGALQTETEAKTKTKTKLNVKVKAAIATLTEKAIRIVIKIRIRPEDKKKLSASTDKRPHYPKGSVVWLMGELKRGQEWKAILPPYTQNKPFSSIKPPHGVKVTKGTPQETLTFIGGKTPFRNVAFDLGVVDGYIDVKHKRIEFTGGGLKTNVGTRIPSMTRGITLTNSGLNIPTRGMSIPAMSPMRVAKFKRKNGRKAERVVA